jgi:uncharacterized membrane protein
MKFLISILSAIFVVALSLGLVLGLRKKYDEESNKDNVLNSYDNTEELIKKYQVINPTTALEGIEKNIQNRLLTGFENWNRGFNTWKAWGNILYTNESIYNVHGARLSLASYQAAMDISLKQQTILMGDFHNMLITGEFAAIHYDFLSGEVGAKKEDLRKSRVMEFVKFKDYGAKLGTRVEEGWGSTKDASGDGLKQGFQADKEKVEQDEQDNYIQNYVIPTTDDLKTKYIIKYPTEYIDSNANTILQIILEGFDNWNKGFSFYSAWIDSAYDTNAKSSSLDERERTMDVYKTEIQELFSNEKIEKLYFDNILIRENWAGLHYRYRREILETHEKSFGDRMQFLKFEEKEGILKITGSWIQ